MFENEKNDKKLEMKKSRPILVMYPGMCSDETEIYVQNAVREAWQRGYQPVLIQYRGASGIEFSSPVTIGSGQYEDVFESIEYVY